MRRDDSRNKLIEENMGLVGKVIKDNVRNIHSIGLYTYEDLFQIGCVGLCIAADTYRMDGTGCFSTYAYVLIRNEIFKALKHATLRQKLENVAEMDKLASIVMEASATGLSYEANHALNAALAEATGVTAKGIEAIRLLAQGYTHREIGERMGGVSANNVSAWVARARKYLRTDESVMSMRDAYE